MRKGFATLFVLFPILLLLVLSVQYFSIPPLESSSLFRHVNVQGVIIQHQLEQFFYDRFTFHLAQGLRDPLLLEKALEEDVDELDFLFPEWKAKPIPKRPFNVLTIPLSRGYLITLFLTPSKEWLIESSDQKTRFILNTNQQWVWVVS